VAETVRVGNLRFPLDRRYYIRKGAHVWLLPGKGGIVKLGMDSFLTENAGFLNYISLDRKTSVRRGGSLGSFESAKFVSRLYSPVSGKVVAVNEPVLKNPRRVNKDPYGSWIVALKVEDLDKSLQSPELIGNGKEIREWIREELRKAEADG
jgi:glycine cleavage system H protein